MLEATVQGRLIAKIQRQLIDVRAPPMTGPIGRERGKERTE